MRPGTGRRTLGAGIGRTLGAALLLAALTGCAGASPGDADDPGGPGSDPGPAAGDTQLTVLAAASLTETFTALASRYEEQHPGVDVRLAFDSSATLATQVLQGAPADVLATADTTTMDSAADALASTPQVVASNTMVLVTPADNPAGLTGFADIADGADGGGGGGGADGDVTWVACVETAPCGRVWAELADLNDVTSRPASLEVDVKSVLAKVTSGEADAGVVYATDAVAAGDRVRTFPVPGSADVVTRYPVAAVAGGETDLAASFIALVTSAEGRRVLADAGFGPP